jgi:hypothetical protein
VGDEEVGFVEVEGEPGFECCGGGERFGGGGWRGGIGGWRGGIGGCGGRGGGGGFGVCVWRRDGLGFGHFGGLERIGIGGVVVLWKRKRKMLDGNEAAEY